MRPKQLWMEGVRWARWASKSRERCVRRATEFLVQIPSLGILAWHSQVERYMPTLPSRAGTAGLSTCVCVALHTDTVRSAKNGRPRVLVQKRRVEHRLTWWNPNAHETQAAWLHTQAQMDALLG